MQTSKIKPMSRLVWESLDFEWLHKADFTKFDESKHPRRGKGPQGGEFASRGTGSAGGKWNHYTSAENATSIHKEGFKNFSNGMFGQGAYFTSKSDDRPGKARVSATSNLKNVLETTYEDFPSKYEELTGEKYLGGNGHEEEYLQELGYDGVHVADVEKGEDWLVAFDPKGINVELEEVV